MIREHLSLICLLALACACGGVDETAAGARAATTRPTCAEIASACHGSTDATGETCHEEAHAASTTEQQCLQMREECLALCGEGGGHEH